MTITIPILLSHLLLFIGVVAVTDLVIVISSFFIAEKVDRTNGNDTGLIATVFMLIGFVVALGIGLLGWAFGLSLAVAIIVTVVSSIISGLVYVKMMSRG